MCSYKNSCNFCNIFGRCPVFKIVSAWICPPLLYWCLFPPNASQWLPLTEENLYISAFWLADKIFAFHMSIYEYCIWVQGVPNKCPIATFSLNLFQRSDYAFSQVFRNQNFEPIRNLNTLNIPIQNTKCPEEAWTSYFPPPFLWNLNCVVFAWVML